MTASVKPTSLDEFQQTTQSMKESTSAVFQPTIPTTIRNVFLFSFHFQFTWYLQAEQSESEERYKKRERQEEKQSQQGKENSAVEAE